MNNRRIFSLTLCVTLCLVSLAALLLLVDDPARAQSSTRYVATTGTDSGGCTDPSNPCATVQYAADQAVSGDVIKVATGVYTDVHGRPVPPEYLNPPVSGIITQVVYIGKTVTIRGGYTAPGFADPPDADANPTTLDAQGQGRVVFLTGAISPTIEGLRMTGGDAYGLGGGQWEYHAGGGIYVINATVTISNCEIYSNTAEWGDGGGLHFDDSDATLIGNTVVTNSARYGGGLFMSRGDATLTKNAIASNSADLAGGLLLTDCDATISGNSITANTADGSSGGGLYLSSSTATLSGNTFSGNTASGLGGGLCLWESGATLSGNTFSSNTTSIYGGGLGLIDSDATLSGNTINRNTSFRGGGLYLIDSDATLNSNTVVSNTAFDWGGGLFLSRANATLSGNTVGENTAVNESGGGLCLATKSNATLINSVIADNQAGDRGSGLYVEYSSSRLSHTTFARNGGGEGSGVYVFGPSTVTLTNTILVSQTVGIIVEVRGTATLESTLWHGNTTDWDGAGTVNHGNDHTGDPAFVDPNAGDYHIGAGSAALDQGVDARVRTDIDHQPRPYLAPDLGADEYWPPGVLKLIYLPLVLRNKP